MAESTVGCFDVREKYYSLTDKSWLINQIRPNEHALEERHRRRGLGEMTNTGHCGLKWQERDDIAEDTIMEAIGVFHTKSYSSSCLRVFTLVTTPTE